MNEFAHIPMKTVGPVCLIGDVNDTLSLPLATYETPLWPSVGRGAKVTRLGGGLNIKIIDERMTRSVIFEAPNVTYAHHIVSELATHHDKMQVAVATGSRHTKLIDIHSEIVGKLLFLRFEFTTGDASGHNMVTAAADELMCWFIQRYPKLTYVSISGNYCVDKKVSAVNGILGRGKHVIAEMHIDHALCESVLKTHATAIEKLNVKKNLVGSILAGSIRSANAHYANMLLAFYLATGQDAANIVEGSQGITYAEADATGLYFSVNIPNIIVGSIGSGKQHDFVRDNLHTLGCLQDEAPGECARRLAACAAATVFCSELSLLAAQTNPGELMRTHFSYERNTKANTTKKKNHNTTVA